MSDIEIGKKYMIQKSAETSVYLLFKKHKDSKLEINRHLDIVMR